MCRKRKDGSTRSADLVAELRRGRRLVGSEARESLDPKFKHVIQVIVVQPPQHLGGAQGDEGTVANTASDQQSMQHVPREAYQVVWAFLCVAGECKHCAVALTRPVFNGNLAASFEWEDVLVFSGVLDALHL